LKVYEIIEIKKKDIEKFYLPFKSYEYEGLEQAPEEKYEFYAVLSAICYRKHQNNERILSKPTLC